MKYTFEKAEKSTVKVTIKLTAKEWAEAKVTPPLTRKQSCN